MRGLTTITLRASATAMLCAAGLAAAVPAAAQTSYSPYAETASAALARYVRTLASSPRDFSALVGAGRAALAVGDTQAAGGFFARADEISPNSPLPQAGMGAVAVHNGDAFAALPFFARAQQLGAPVATFGADRGLAFDLLGRQAEAQADYRAALGGLDSDEARRRLALSLAISGKRQEALDALAPLIAKRDMGAYRCRAFILALTGDNSGALAAIDAAMPGNGMSMAPFLSRLPALQAGQKAAAVNLGIFPESGAGQAYASAPPGSGIAGADRLADLDQLLRSSPPAPQPNAQASAGPPPSWTLAPAAPPARAQVAQAQAAKPLRERKIWLQLASGPNPDALPREYRQIKSRNRDVLDGIKGFVARSVDRARLIIGPFRSSDDAETFAQGLDSVNAFRWTNSETDTITPLSTD